MTTLTLSQLWRAPLNWLKHSLGLREKCETAPDQDHDNPLLKNHTHLQTYATSHATYPGISTFYRPHAHIDKLKSISHLPLLVLIHGIGGSLPQFAPLLGSFVNFAPCFAIEAPGHGGSEFAPKNYEAYTFEALAELWKVAIETVCQENDHQKVVLLGHSLGCSIALALSSAISKSKLDIEVIGFIAICPKATPPPQSLVTKARWFLSLPDLILDVFRWFDRRGEEKSQSVRRFVGEAANIDLKRLQLQFNKRFKTPVWKRVSKGLLPTYDKLGVAHGGIPGRSMWEELKVPLLLIAGEADTVTKAKEASEIIDFVQHRSTKMQIQQQSVPTMNPSDRIESSIADDEQYGVKPMVRDESGHSLALKLVTLPAPASHALMYDHSTYRTVAGLIEDFLDRHVAHELSLGWQLQQLTTSGKWDVKNLQKWKKVLPVSGPIGNGQFRALKTLREQDEEHTPTVFLQNWGQKIFAVIDISHDSPIYDAKALEKGGVQYHKFPTVSKIPPTLVEVQNFIALVDRLREEIKEKFPDRNPTPAIAVHCHYGYNRTGFFIVCYLIERCGYRIQDAIEEFAQAKPPGIKHDHFIDTLFVRYTLGLRKSSTFE